MTWKEFKEEVEKQGVKDEDIIGMIDLIGNIDKISVEKEEDEFFIHNAEMF